MAQTVVLFRVDIGYNPGKGYGATIVDVQLNRMKGIKGNSIRNLMRNVNQVVCDEEQKKRRFPLEQESAPMIITPPNGF